MQDDFGSFLRRREAAAQSYSNGDATSLCEIAAESDQATFFHHTQGFTKGAAAVQTVYRDGATAFGAGGSTWFDIRDKGQDGDIGYWTGFQFADVMLTGQLEKQTLKVNVTEIFRHDGTAWRLIHRHASLPAQIDG